MTRKDKKQEKPASRRQAAPLAEKKRKGKNKGKAKAKRRAEAAEARALRPRSEAPKPRGSEGKSKKRRKQSASEGAAPQTATPTPIDTEVLPHVDLDTSYELTADGDDLDALSADAPELGIGSRVVAPHVRFEQD
ncbi:MAG TPA: hypothetical protein VNG33_17250, partial [Polyangiaceae bacterium]|nr:hypothetical protein [Polyangiaceae bacterium]